MKRLAILLLFANIGFTVWHTWKPEKQVPEVPYTGFQAVASLDRLSDVDLDELTPRVPVSLRRSSGRTVDNACFAIGPMTGDYGDGTAMGRVREWLTSRGGEVGLRTDKHQEITYYWVYFPPTGTRDTARIRVKELAASAFTDALVISEGNMRNAVSVGIYGLRSLLERDLARLQTKGLEPEVRRVRRTGTAIWFTTQFPAEYEFPHRRFSVAFPGLEAVDSRCPEPPPPAPQPLPPAFPASPEPPGGTPETTAPPASFWSPAAAGAAPLDPPPARSTPSGPGREDHE